MASKLGDGDSFVFIHNVESDDNIVFRTKNHYFLRIDVSEVPEQKKNALGVKGISLSEKDEVTDVYLLKKGIDHTVEVDGKKVILQNMKINKRAAKGTKR